LSLFKVPIIRAFLMICCYAIKKSSLFSRWKQVSLPLTIFSNYFGVVSATLLVAINEIRRSARAKGLSFYQYGMCRYSNEVCGYLKQNLFPCICRNNFVCFPFPLPLLICFLVTNTFYKLYENLLI